VQSRLGIAGAHPISQYARGELGMTESLKPTKILTPPEQARLDRLAKTMRNARGRRNPAVMPAKLARTSAFAPRSRQLDTDSNFRRLYVVEGHSVTEVAGRELGTQHRDLIYAIFRFRADRLEIPNPEFNPAIQIGPIPTRRTLTLMQITCTWRDLMRSMGLTEHVNNMLNQFKLLEEIKRVTFTVFLGDYRQYLAATSRGELSGAGFSDNLLGAIEWDGVTLDSKLTIRYGEWVRQMFERSNLVSVNGDVYFRLSSEYAKAFWPFLDSQPQYRYTDEPFLAQLAGRHLPSETTKQRMKFREEVRQAFLDMQRAGGLAHWEEEIVGRGRAKFYRWHYTHALPRQCELALNHPSVAGNELRTLPPPVRRRASSKKLPAGPGPIPLDLDLEPTNDEAATVS
jgi:hypothetical protein